MNEGKKEICNVRERICEIISNVLKKKGKMKRGKMHKIGNKEKVVSEILNKKSKE